MDEGALRTMRARLAAQVHPAALGDVGSAARAKLDNLLLRWRPEIGGAVVCYANEALVDGKALVLPYLPFVSVDIAADLLVFAPAAGCHLVGKIHRLGSDYVGMLVLGVFNAVVPVANIADEHRDALKSPQRRASAGSGGAAGSGDARKGRAFAVGDNLRFRVVRTQVEGDLLTIVGSLNSEGTGLWHGHENGVASQEGVAT